MALGVDLSILNQRGTPAFFSDIFANRPAFGFAGRVFISTDTGAIYEDTGTGWTLIADAGAGTTGTLQQVTTNGKTTTQGISITGGQLTMGAQSIELGNSITSVSGNVRIQGDDTNNFTNETTGVKVDYGNSYIRITDKQNSNFTKYINFRSTGFTANYGILLPNADGNIALQNTAFTAGSIVFTGANGILNQDNSNFFWDDTNNRLGLGTITPSSKLDIHGAGAMATFNGTGANNGYIGFQNAGATKWTIGNQYTGVVNNFQIINRLGNSVFSITGDQQANFEYNVTIKQALTLNNVGDQLRISSGAIDGSIHTNSGDNLMFIGATSTSYGLNIDLSTGSLAVTDRVTATRFVLSGATADTGLYYNAAANRVTIANYTTAGTVLIETNGGITAATFNADQTTTFAKSINVNSTGSTQIFLKTSGGGANRDWQLQTNESAAGDLSIMQSTTAGGATYATKVNIGATGIVNALNGVKFGSGTGTLNYYETGTWTPILQGAGTPGSYTLSNVIAKYTIIGNLVTLFCKFTVTVNSAGTAYGIISGLPINYAANSAICCSPFLTNYTFTNALSKYITLAAPTSSSSNTIYLAEIVSGAIGTDSLVTGWTTGSTIQFTLTYNI